MPIPLQSRAIAGLTFVGWGEPIGCGGVAHGAAPTTGMVHVAMHESLDGNHVT